MSKVKPTSGLGNGKQNDDEHNQNSVTSNLDNVKEQKSCIEQEQKKQGKENDSGMSQFLDSLKKISFPSISVSSRNQTCSRELDQLLFQYLY